MLCRLHATVAGVLAWFVIFGVQTAPAADAEIAFEPPKVVVVRQSNGAPARGHLLRITENDLWIRVLNGSEVRLKLERVRSVKSSDQTLEFWPGSESVYDFAARMRKAPGVKVAETVRKGAKNGARGPAVGNSNSAADDADAQRNQNQTPKSGDSKPYKNQLADATQSQHGRTAPPRETDDLNVPAEPAEGNSGDPQFGTEVLTCSNCMQDLPANFRSGGKCPHCGKIAVFDNGGASNPFTVAGNSGGTGGNPFATNGAAPAAPQNQAPPVVPQVQNQGFDMANMPWFAKAGIFAVFIVVGWMIMQRRG